MDVLQTGIYLLKQNVVYALPPYRARLGCFAPTPTIQIGTSQGMAITIPKQLTDGYTDVGGGFIRCTSGDIEVVISK